MSDELTTTPPEPAEEVPVPAPAAASTGINLNEVAISLVNGAVRHAPWSTGLALVIAVFFHYADPTIERYFDVKEKECASLEEVKAEIAELNEHVTSINQWRVEHESVVLDRLGTILEAVNRSAASSSGGPHP